VNITFIINDLSGGGAEKALLHLAGYLQRSGVRVSLVTLQSGDDAYTAPPGIERRTLNTGRFARGPGKIIGLPLQARELAAVLRQLDPDASISFLPRANVAHVLTRWFGNSSPVLVTEQVSSRDAYPSNGPADRFMRFLIRTCYPRADAVFPSSQGVLEGLVHFGVRRERMRVVYNSVALADIQRLALKPVPELPPAQVPTVITVGRHAPQKDHETLLRAFAIVRARIPARLVLLGQGPLRNSLLALAAQLDIADSVMFAGFQDNPFAWLARGDLFVLSSRYEGFGNVLIEAMACGLPVVSTDCPSGPREILRDGRAGILVPVADVAALAESMYDVLTDDGLRSRLAESARLRAPDFDDAVIGEAYIDLISSFASRRHSPRVAAALGMQQPPFEGT
jgi:glycosyltransferase involved in cell wall biosynthesis